MSVEHLEILVEEPSMEAFLRALLPRMLGEHLTFEVHPFQCKDDMFKKLPARLRGYAHWLPATHRIVVLVDRDDDDCEQLKARMQDIALGAGLRLRQAGTKTPWQVVNRIVIEELEAWYFGDWEAVRRVYPRVNANTVKKQGFRDADAIAGGTWEAFERILKRAGYFVAGLRKTEAARLLGREVDPDKNRSRSFQVFRDVVLSAAS